MQPKTDKKPSDVADWLDHVRRDDALRHGLGDLAKLKRASVVKLAGELARGKKIDAAQVAKQMSIPRDRLAAGYRSDRFLLFELSGRRVAAG